MKKYSKKIKAIFIVLILLIGTIILVQNKIQKDQDEYDNKVGKAYKWQNRVFAMVDVPYELRVYSPYEKIDEKELYISLFVYNSIDQEKEALALEDIEEYLSDEFNEDGTLRVINGYEEIKDYIFWWCFNQGVEHIEDYRNKIISTITKYNISNPSLSKIEKENLSLEQLSEFIKVIENEMKLEDIDPSIIGIDIK